jgi:hypothetical protein
LPPQPQPASTIAASAAAARPRLAIAGACHSAVAAPEGRASAGSSRLAPA